MADDQYYDSLISKKINPNNTIDLLYKPVQKDKMENMAHFYSYKHPNIVQQADLLYLPEDDGYKYALVVTDLHKRTTDARPLKTKQPNEVLNAFKSIYSGKYLKLPKRILLDAGNEFKSVVAAYFKDNKVNIKVALPDRHRQQGIVENKNLILGRSLHKRMAEQELLVGTVSKEWIEDLPKVISAVNRTTKDVPEKNKGNIPVCSGEACELLNIGDMVRVMLDAPRDVASDKKLHGKFRASDIRWSLTPLKIVNIHMNAGMPPLYALEGRPSVAYTRNQIQLVDANEKLPNPKQSLRGNQSVFKVEKILEKKKINGIEKLKILWFGYTKPTYETYSKIKEDVPLLVAEFEKSIKKPIKQSQSKTNKKVVSNKKPVKNK